MSTARVEAETNRLKAEEVVLRATLAQRPQRLQGPPKIPSSPPPPLVTFKPKSLSSSSSASEDEGRPSTSCNSSDPETDDSDSVKLLKFERKSSSSNEDDTNKEATLHRMPYPVLKRIFSRLEVSERAKTAAVCRRFYNILTDGHCPLENVIVFNIFQKSIWEASVNRNAGSSVQCIQMPSMEALLGILLHVSEPSSIKIWYNTPKFAQLVLEKIAEVSVKTKCVDIFPYSDKVGIDHFYEQLPNLTGITMRPHGTDYFWNGLDLDYFPNFQHLDTLILDSFNLRGDLELPESITTLEFQNRRDNSFIEILPKLAKLKKLEYLLVGHADLQSAWTEFISTIETDHMPRLTYLMLRFCRFGKDSLMDTNVFYPQKHNSLQELKFLKLDLCYGYMPRLIENFLAMTSEKLKFVSINMISDESFGLFEQIYGDISKWFKDRSICLNLGLLQKSERSKENVNENERREVEPVYLPPSYNFQKVLWKFESSFCDNKPLLQSMFISTNYPFLQELKYIHCPAVSNEILEAIAVGCPRLRKLSLLSCNNADKEGIVAFLEHFHSRISKKLEIIWKRDIRRHSRPAAFYLEMTHSYKHLLDGLKTRFYTKSSADFNSGESIVIEEKIGTKSLIIQDYDHHDNQRILGVVVPFDEEPNVSTAAVEATTLPAVETPPPAYSPPPIPESPINNANYAEIPVTSSPPSTPTESQLVPSLANLSIN